MEKDTIRELTEERVREIVREEVERIRAMREALTLEIVLGPEGARQWLAKDQVSTQQNSPEGG